MKNFNKSILTLLSVIILFTTVLSGNSYAGSNQDQEIKYSPEEVAEFAKAVEKFAAKQGARAFIISRVGRPIEDLPKGIKYTHTAIAVYSEIALANNEIAYGYAIHNLYQTNEDKSKSILVTDYPVDFFWGAHELKAGITIPSQELQTKIIELIAKGDNKVLHNSAYSVLANPFNDSFQNCTEHTLDIINAAIYNTTDTAQLKANAAAYFQPQPVHTSRFKLLVGSALMQDVTLKDHDRKVKTTTFTSITRYLEKYDLLQSAVEFNQDFETTNI